MKITDFHMILKARGHRKLFFQKLVRFSGALCYSGEADGADF